MVEKGKTTLAMRVCRQCGISFMGGPRAWYCPDCRYERQKESTRLSRQRKRLGLTRALGSTGYCVVCGEPYVVESANQKYCPKCAPEAIRAIDRQQSLEWAREKLKDKDYVDARNEKRRACVMEKTCPICGKKFSTRVSVKKTCSDECRKVWVRYITNKTGELADYQIGGKMHVAKQPELIYDGITCPMCGKPTNGENYCCESCADAGRRYLATRNTKRCKGEPLPNFDDYRIGRKNYKKVRNEIK